MRRTISLFALFLSIHAATCLAGEIGYIEEFSLAPDRTVALEQLIPGTEEYYYYHCLHFQNNEQFDKVDDLLKAWIKRHNYTSRVNEIRYRQALLTYDRDHAKSLDFIRQALNIRFDHQRETLGFQHNLPTKLNQKLIERETLVKRAYSQHSNLNGFEDAALDWLIGRENNPDRRRHLLQRLTRPDHENLATLVVADLKHRYSRGFGSMEIHRQLLLSQLDECVKLMPELLNQANYVNAYLTKLRPNADVDWRNDPEETVRYLDRLAAFVQRLAPVHNSLKAHVLYHRLVHDRSQGMYDKDRFMAYVSLPRHASYMNADFMKRETSRKYAANLNANYHSHTLLPSIGNDESLVRSYLHHFFVKEATFKPYAPYINDIYLKHNFAETKIVNGLGEPEEWYSMLPPAQYQTLKERIDLDFAYTNKRIFQPEEDVQLDLHVKNVKSLLVKVYRINTQNYYRETGREVGTDIPLDGLVANEEQAYEFKEPSLRRVKRHFEFPQMKGRGVYVIDFIGNGQSSRVLVRKGRLRFLSRTSTAGQVVTVLDEQNNRIDDASVWMSGHEYKADEKGRIVVPFSTQPGRQPIVLTSGDFSSLEHLNHEAEAYNFVAGVYVDREALQTRRKAQVIVRPSLLLNGTPVSLSILEDVSLTIVSTDLDGVSTSKQVKDFELFEDRESTFEFLTPQRLARLQFQLTAKVKNLSNGRKDDLSASQAFMLNGIIRTEKVEDLHFSQIAGGYVLDVLGRSGEVRADRPVHFSIKHRDFKSAVSVSLQTDKLGRIDLGPLDDIDWIEAKGPEGTAHRWQLLRDRHSQYASVHGEAGGELRVPLMRQLEKASRDELSLLELRDGTYVADRFSSLSVSDGLLIAKDLAAGDYDLLLKRSGSRVRLRIAEGKARDGYVLGKHRQLEVRNPKPLQISRVGVDDEKLNIQLVNAGEFARVHVLATRYRPEFSAYGNLSRVRDAEPYVISVPTSLSKYVVGRNIGDEYRYIIDRKYARKFPGNMLTRPSLLLNPWAIRKTQTSQQQAQGGTEFSRSGEDRKSDSEREPARRTADRSQQGFSNLDFLAETTAVIVNVPVDEDGKVSIERELLGQHQYIDILAVDPKNTVCRTVALPAVDTKMRDLRLIKGLDPKQHFTQQKQISVVLPKKDFVVKDVASSKFERYDSLARVYSLYTTLSNDPKLVQFRFILGWPELKDEEKRRLYSKFACHELSFFVQQRDPNFFKHIVRPYLENKKDKTYLDHWLLGSKLADYAKPWQHAQLNVVERVLLGRSIKSQRDATAQHITDTNDLIPPNIDRFNMLFNTALKGRSLDTNDDLSILAAIDHVKTATERDVELQMLTNGIANNWGALRQGQKQSHRNQGSGQGADKSFANGNAAEAEMPANRPASQSDSKSSKGWKDEGQGRGSNREELLARRGKLSKKNDAGKDALYFDDDRELREVARQLYRKLDSTQEWVENNYYQLPIAQQNGSLVQVNNFWNDYASADDKSPFYSIHFAEASRNFTEMMFALSVLDLPFKAAEHKSDFDGPTMTLKPGSALIAFHEEVKPATLDAKKTPILVSQNFFRHGDRHRYVNNERIDKYVDDEFLVHTVYGCQVVITNPTSTPQKLDLLLQIPVGAIPVLNTHVTRNIHVNLAPYNTKTVEYHFYFPAVGKYPHYPVQVAKNEALLAFAEPFTFNVVKELSKIDRTSWDYISQHGSSEDVIEYLKTQNLGRTTLSKIAFRMQDKRFFETVTKLVASRFAYDHTLWSYGLKHDDVRAVREYLQHANAFVSLCGSAIESPLLTIDPVVRKTYEHMEYRPLVNARAHQLGRRRQILNDRFYQQYHRLLKVLSYRRELTDSDLMAVTYYLLLQDRVEEAIEFFGQVDAKNLTTGIQYDYFKAYIACYLEDVEQARDIAKRYLEFPVDRWRNTFVALDKQLEEIVGAETAVVDEESRDQKQAHLASTEPSFEFQVESKEIRLNYENLSDIKVNYYLMDIELLFSRNPFVQEFSGEFSYITPIQSQTVRLPADKTSHVIDLPKNYHNQNVLVEIIGGGQTKTQAYYSNSLNLQLTENYGQLKVSHGVTGKPLSTTYVKVYARMKDGNVRFYKDGYTDLRGRFDYTSLNTNELDFVERFSLLVLSDEHGAIVREAAPPKR